MNSTSAPTFALPAFEPRATFPPRAAPSVRRVMHLDYEWVDRTDVRVRGAARDEVTDARGATTTVDESAVAFETEGGLLVIARLTPALVEESQLVGHPLRAGFRRLVRDRCDPQGATLGLLLDDVSGALVAASYVTALTAPGIGAAADEPAPTPEPAPAPSRAAGPSSQADYCAGWRADGTMMVALGAGRPLPFRPLPPVAPLPDGADGWPTPPIPAPGLRRHRRIDVTPAGGEWHVDAWFRDTFCAEDGTCGALHEYTVTATVGADDRRIRSIAAAPHALPWPECPAAADAVVKLVGQSLEGLRSSVPATLSGIESCTHLTNELRELADVPAMLARR